MRSLRGSLVMAMTAGALLILPMSNTRVTRMVSRAASEANQDPKTLYGPQQKEFWLSADEFGYIRPGLHITVNSITIPDDLKPVVDVTYVDDAGVPLDRSGAITPGPISMSFIMALWRAEAQWYASYTSRVQTSPITGVKASQASADSGGSWTDIDIGHSVYKFGTALPADFDRAATTTLGIYATRDMTGIQTKNYYDNVEQDFVPNGSPVTQTWDMINTGACNQCHNPLQAHGGSRYQVKLCVLCHSPETIPASKSGSDPAADNTDPDTGNTIDFRVMVHKIHMGEELPSVQAGIPYQIIGFQQSLNDFSTVAFPQDVRNCATCHGQNSSPDQPYYASQAYYWYTYPTKQACGSCHDNINWVTGDGHAGGPQPTNDHCAECHIPQGGREWDASVQGAHVVPYNSTQLKGINAAIVSVTNTAPGQNPTIQFQLSQNDGTPYPPSYFAAPRTLAVLMGGPTTDYAVNPNDFRETASGATFDGTTATYTFTHAIPADATGTWAFSLEARQTVPLDPHPQDATTFNEAAFNPVYYAAVTDATPQPRRLVVDLANCDKCHNKLMLHGNLRQNTQMCVICHNPNENDAARRPPDQAPPESVDMKRMIHRIHTGDEDTQQYTIYGFGGTPNNFNDVRYPGDLRDCMQCHVTTDAAPAGTQQVFEEPPPGLLPTQTLRDWYTPMQHYAASCLGCHTTQPAAAHAFTMTANFPNGTAAEACAACHGPDAQFSVDKMHAR